MQSLTEIFHLGGSGSKRPKIREALPGQGKADVQTVIIQSKEIELQSVIGEGQFGKVYKGRCRGGPVAIKRINLAKSDLDELMGEIQILAAERHNNIVLLLGVCECSNGELMIVTELCGRGDLRKILETASIHLSLRRKIQFAVDIATGMAWMAEGCGDTVILHRDLKPANVLVTQEWQCKIADFGLANIKRKNKTYKDTEFLPGSLPYMAPEVFESKELTPALDVYSYGIVLWEVYTRETRWFAPIGDTFEEDVVKNHKRPDIKKIANEEYKIITQACWSHSPAARPSFTNIPVALQQMRIDIFLSNFPPYAKLWRSNWLADDQVTFADFSQAIFQLCGVAYTDHKVQLFQRLACPLIQENSSVDHGEDMIGIDHFQQMLFWLAPQNDKDNILDVMYSLCSKPWFFGILSSSEAKQRLTGTPEGTFLVRVNQGNKIDVEDAPFILTRVDPFTKEIRHTYIQSEGPSKLLARIHVDFEHKAKMHDVRASTLKDLLQQIFRVKVVLEDKTQVPFIESICPGYPFADLFISPKKIGQSNDSLPPVEDSSDSLDD
jgi:serine/threonine protein kinase